MTDKLKICMIGASAVGKTSLLSRFVSSIFHERYSTTIGVKIQVRRLARPGREVDLVLWDLSGEDEFQSVQPSYLRGAAGYLLVIDGTRRDTFETALALQRKVSAATGDVPFLVVLNKADLAGSWSVSERDLDELMARGWPVVRTSAKTGDGVEEAFEQLTTTILDFQARPAWI
jgi:small GTP-binding protein